MSTNFIFNSKFDRRLAQSHSRKLTVKEQFEEINPTDNVYEIGPGDGALTEFLFQKVNSITAYEIDRSLVPILNKKFSERNLEIVNIDFLNANLEELSNANSVIVGNLPYNVSSQIILKILESKITFKHCIFMVQNCMMTIIQKTYFLKR